MVNWIEPQYSKTRVRNAGKSIRDGSEDIADLVVVENWRACHSYILNTFQANLRKRTRGTNVVVAQRLKRRHTIFDKLKREPHMQLPTMHDIAGCRLIFDDEFQLMAFRRKMHKASFRHKCHSKDDGRYNYIDHPKDSGYRGIHDVYEYDVGSVQGVKWNGLHIEIQYRTKYQHAWATAVEVADLISTSRIKFSDADFNHKRFFQLASEIIARSQESRKSCLPEISNQDLVNEFHQVDRRIGLMLTFENLKQSKDRASFKMNTILIFKGDVLKNVENLSIETFESVNKAISRYEQLEKEYAGTLTDIVLVRADTSEDIRVAFRNYFSDTNDFLKYVNEGCANLLR